MHSLLGSNKMHTTKTIALKNEFPLVESLKDMVALRFQDYFQLVFPRNKPWDCPAISQATSIATNGKHGGQCVEKYNPLFFTCFLDLCALFVAAELQI